MGLRFWLLEAEKRRREISIMERRYQELNEWLKSFPVTEEDIKKHFPKYMHEINKAIDKVDKCFFDRDLQGFTDNMEKVKSLYSQAILKVYQKINQRTI